MSPSLNLRVMIEINFIAESNFKCWFIVLLFVWQIYCKMITLLCISEKSWLWDISKTDFVCPSACRLVLHIWSRRKLRTRRQMMNFIEFNKTVCTKKALNVATVKHLSTYWHYVYINDVRLYVYQKYRIHNGQTK